MENLYTDFKVFCQIRSVVDNISLTLSRLIIWRRILNGLKKKKSLTTLSILKVIWKDKNSLSFIWPIFIDLL